MLYKLVHALHCAMFHVSRELLTASTDGSILHSLSRASLDIVILSPLHHISCDTVAFCVCVCVCVCTKSFYQSLLASCIVPVVFY